MEKKKGILFFCRNYIMVIDSWKESKIMNPILLEIIVDMERKLRRRLTAKEYKFVKWMVEKHLKG